MNPHYPLVAQRAAHRCEYCQAPEAVFNFPFEVEHVTPPGRRGQDIESNWALSCRSCNLYKSMHIDGVDPDSEIPARLFDPRRDVWTNHFRVTLENGRIVGITDVGRATVARLQMNTAAQLQAPHQWIR